MAIEPSAVTTHDKSEIAPTLAMFVGSMMISEPVMLTATMKVSWIRVILFRSSTAVPSNLFTYGVRVLGHLDAQFDTAVPQRFTRKAFVHLRVDVERREQRMEGRRRGMDEERLVETPRLDIAPLFAYV